MKSIEYTLPEWSFLTGNCHDGDVLNNRTVLLHFPSYTILEVVTFDEIKEFNFKGPTFQFQNFSNEKLILYLHCTLSHNIDKIFKECADWYGEYLDWKGKNNLIEEKSKQN